MVRLIFIFLILYSSAAQFGQNKVQYKDFKWRFIQTKHFDVYFYKGGEVYAEFTAEVMEKFYKDLGANWSYKLKERIAIFVYNSHNDFKQSLVVDSYLSESIGGVTELFKNRIIVPFEGDYMKFDHVIKHELVHAVMNDLLYDGSIQNVISRRVSQPPLWFSEGIAEWEASGWNPRLDMAVRDMVINGTIPPIEFLEYVSPYQGGASVFKYIAKRFGREKVAELLKKAAASFNFYAAMERVLKLSREQFTEDWHRYLRKQYWPEIENKDEASQISIRLTKHQKDKSYINTAPVISPKGDKIAYLSNKEDGYVSIYLIDSFTGKPLKRLVKGNTSADLDQMHWLNPGLSFSPDGKTLLFASFAGEADLLNFADVETGDISSISFELDGLFSPKYSPDGKKILFVGTKNGASDIFIYTFETKKLQNLTNDVYSDLSPNWSNDGSSIVFVSDRGENTQVDVHPYKFKMFDYAYEFKDIYTIDVNTRHIDRITNTIADENHPVFSSDDTFVAFTSDRTGISNIYLKNLNTNEEEYAITSLLTGASNLDWSKDGSQLVFSSFFGSGYDLYSITNPSKKPAITDIEDTYFLKSKDSHHFKTIAKDKGSTGRNVTGEYARYNFAQMSSQSKRKEKLKSTAPVFLDETDIKEDGKYKVRDYETDWTMDYINGTTAYDNLFGLSAQYTFNLSDLSGKHRFALQSDLILNFKNADAILQYANLGNQVNYIYALFHISNRFYSNGNTLTYRQYGANVAASYPLNRFERIDIGAQYTKYELSSVNSVISSAPATVGSLSYTFDNSKPYMTGPIDGNRFKVTGLLAPPTTETSAAFMTLKLDYRKYIELGTGFAFAMRFAGGASRGLRKVNGHRVGETTFRMGGVNFWVFNTKYQQNDGQGTSDNPDVQSVDQISFSEFVTPLRGAYYNSAHGSKFAITNLEFRFPFIDYLIARVPPLPFQGIRGSVFTDFGYAWDKPLDELRLFKDGEPQDIIWGWGFGIQANVPFLGLLRFDKAWRYGSAYPDPVYYFSFGLDF